MNTPPCLECVVLFDIDGTLVTGPAVKPSAGVGAMNQSARLETGIDGLYRQVEFAGRTDRQIVRDLLAAAGMVPPPAEAVARLIDRYIAFLEDGVLQRPYVLLGGVRDTVLALRARGAIVGLGTGNIRRGAEAKLRSAGIPDLFDFDLGGYGDDADTRGQVLRIGATRCDPSGTLPVVIVGDTPHDISAAHEIGAVCVGITTGRHDESALRDAGADEVIAALDPGLIGMIERIVGNAG